VGKEMVALAKAATSQDSKVFQFQMDDFRKSFVKAGQVLGLGNLHPYQLRHGGATDDLATQRREYNVIKARGRWKTDSSMRRYAKTGKIQQLLEKLSPCNLQYCKWSEKNLQKVFAGTVQAKSPSQM